MRHDSQRLVGIKVITDRLQKCPPCPAPQRDATRFAPGTASAAAGGARGRWQREGPRRLQPRGTSETRSPRLVKCRTDYAQGDMMNRITATVNQPMKMDRWFEKVVHLRIRGEEGGADPDRARLISNAALRSPRALTAAVWAQHPPRAACHPPGIRRRLRQVPVRLGGDPPRRRAMGHSLRPSGPRGSASCF